VATVIIRHIVAGKWKQELIQTLVEDFVVLTIKTLAVAAVVMAVVLMANTAPGQIR
jgi:hypothetical protein